MPYLTRHTYDDFICVLREACTWLDSHGIRTPQTRIGEYLRLLQDVEQRYKRGDIGTYTTQSNFDRFGVALLEAYEIVDLYKGTRHSSMVGLTQKLSRLAKGPFHPRDESPGTSSNKGRDVAFELCLCGKLGRVGMQPDISTEADLVVTCDGYRAFVEAKRPQSYGSLQKRYEEGVEQLARRLVQPEAGNEIGIMAVSASKVLNPTMKFLNVRSEQELKHHLREEAKRLLNFGKPCWRTKKIGKQVGLILHFQVPVILWDKSLPIAAEQIASVPMCAKGTREYSVFSKLTNSLLQAIGPEIPTLTDG